MAVITEMLSRMNSSSSATQIRRLASLIRFKPFDISTPEGHANERYRRVALTSITSAIARSVGILTGFISVPLTLNYLGTERYGLWMTISSVIVMLGFTDFGLGNGLVNAISQADGKNDHTSAQKSISSVFFLLLCSAILILLIFAIGYPFIPWQRIFNVTSGQAVRESGPATAVFVVCFVVNLLLGIVQKVQLGYQEGHLNNYWQIAGNVMGLVAVFAVINLQGSLPWLVFAMSGVPALALAVNWCFLFYYQRPELLPCWSNFHLATGKAMLGTGMIFVLLWVVNILGTSTDNIIIAQYLGPSEVATFSVVQRLFSLTFLVQFITTPLWPAFSEALARGDHNWARRTYIRAQVLTSGLTVLICLPLLFLGQTIIKIWSGPLVVPSMALLGGFTLFRLISGIAEAAMPVMHTEFFIRRLLMVNATAGIVSFALKIYFVQIWQAAGIAWAGALGYGLLYMLPVSIIAYRGLKKYTHYH